MSRETASGYGNITAYLQSFNEAARLGVDFPELDDPLTAAEKGRLARFMMLALPRGVIQYGELEVYASSLTPVALSAGPTYGSVGQANLAALQTHLDRFQEGE